MAPTKSLSLNIGTAINVRVPASSDAGDDQRVAFGEVAFTRRKIVYLECPLSLHDAGQACSRAGIECRDFFETITERAGCAMGRSNAEAFSVA